MDKRSGGKSVGLREERVAPGVAVRRTAAGEPESLRICFQFRGRECKEPIGLTPSTTNIRYASNLRGEILNAIGHNTFNYAKYFPGSKNAVRFGFMSPSATVGEEIKAFMAIARLAGSTRLTYERVIAAYLEPWFGTTLLRDLSAPMIRARVLAVRREDGVTPVTLKTARNILTPLGSTLELAVADGKIPTNPMDAVKLERFWPEEYMTSDWEADPFAWAEMVAIFGACDGGAEGEEADYWRYAFGSGMRPSEQIELHWPRLDLVQHRARVEVARVTARATTPGGNKNDTIVKKPKTMAGRRDIDFTNGAWEALQRQQERTRLAGAHVWRDTRYGAPWRNEEALRKRFETILKRAGVRYRNPYQTRHTFGSSLLAAGYDPRWVAEQMGHETTEMLERHYGRWINQGRDPAARAALERFFAHVSPTVAKVATLWR